MTSEKRINRIRKRGWQTAYAFPRVPRGVRAMPVKTQPRVLRGDGFAENAEKTVEIVVPIGKIHNM